MKVQRLRPKKETGAGLVEFAILAPLFVALLFGLVEFGLALYSKGMITNASREGARFGVVYSTPRKTDAEIKSKVQEYLADVGFLQTASVNVDGAQGTSGTPLTCHILSPA